jgi:DNA-binding NtrC family response regulator
MKPVSRQKNLSINTGETQLISWYFVLSEQLFFIHQQENHMSEFRLLLVDDEREFVKTIALRLRHRGFVVECAFSGTEALKRLEKDDDFDVVILDVRMPDPDGIKTVERVKTKHPLVEVIMLTGYATVHSAVEALKFGAFDYLMKPCDLNDLISKVEQAVSRKKDREYKIRDVRMKPYISERERDEMIFRIMNTED